MLFLGCLTALFTSPVVMPDLLYPAEPTRLTATRCQDLRLGMTRLQVAALVGGRGAWMDGRTQHVTGHLFFRYVARWETRGLNLSAFFDARGRLVDAFYHLQPGDDLQLIPRLRERP
jgi:hypothetical protein